MIAFVDRPRIVFSIGVVAVCLVLMPPFRSNFARRSSAAEVAVVLTPPGRVITSPFRAARRVAERFLSLYAIAYGRELTPRERSQWRNSASAHVAGYLLAQPPEGRLRGGHLISLDLGARNGDYAARATLGFGSRRARPRLWLARDAGRHWRVVAFLPGLDG